jgi:uncharacterized protein VirK/YbjX
MSTPRLDNVLTKQERIAKLARERPQLTFSVLNHYLDYDWMQEAYERTRKDGAVGIDGHTGV